MYMAYCTWRTVHSEVLQIKGKNQLLLFVSYSYEEYLTLAKSTRKNNQSYEMYQMYFNANNIAVNSLDYK